MATTPTATSPNSKNEAQALHTTVETSTTPAHPTLTSNNNPSKEDLLNEVSSEDEPMESEPYDDSSPRRVTPTSSPSHFRRRQSGSRVIRTTRETAGSPQASPYPNPITIDNTSNQARYRADARRWSWLPVALATWRIEEEIQLPTETGEPSAMDLSPYTQEPTHFTVPVLAARLHRHEKRLTKLSEWLADLRKLWNESSHYFHHQIHVRISLVLYFVIY